MTTDPFEALRVPDDPTSPSTRFVNRLRAQLVAALTGNLPHIELPERKPTMTTTTTSDPSTITSDSSQGTPSVLVPYLSVAGAAEAITWYVDVLGAREILRYDADDGRIGHAELDFSGAMLHLADEYPEFGFVGPRTLGGSGTSITLQVADVDAIYASAVAAGAEGQREPHDEPYGDRSASIVDPFGHRWMIQTPIATPSVDEINEAMTGFTVKVADAGTDAGTDEGANTAASAVPKPVELGYFTMSAPDTARAIEFFGALFGWTAEAGPAGEGYAHISNTRLPLGFTPGPAEDASELYFRVDDAAAAAVRVRELGGEVLSEQDYDSGRDAECRDDQGRRFHLWQPAPGY